MFKAQVISRRSQSSFPSRAFTQEPRIIGIPKLVNRVLMLLYLFSYDTIRAQVSSTLGGKMEFIFVMESEDDPAFEVTPALFLSRTNYAQDPRFPWLLVR